jgi:hypothetical protein
MPRVSKQGEESRDASEQIEDAREVSEQGDEVRDVSELGWESEDSCRARAVFSPRFLMDFRLSRRRCFRSFPRRLWNARLSLTR